MAECTRRSTLWCDMRGLPRLLVESRIVSEGVTKVRFGAVQDRDGGC